jgi:hypothetical protein
VLRCDLPGLESDICQAEEELFALFRLEGEAFGDLRMLAHVDAHHADERRHARIRAVQRIRRVEDREQLAQERCLAPDGEPEPVVDATLRVDVDLHVEIELRRDVVVQRARGEPHRLGDVLVRDARVAAGGEQAATRVEDRPVRVGGVAVRGATPATTTRRSTSGHGCSMPNPAQRSPSGVTTRSERAAARQPLGSMQRSGCWSHHGGSAGNQLR